MFQVKLLNDNATIPTKAYPSDAGYDMYASENVTLLPGVPTKIPTGISVRPSKGDNSNVYTHIAGRSSMGMKGLYVGGGVVDRTYKGEVGVIITNLTRTPYLVQKRDKIAQMIIIPILDYKLQVVDELIETGHGPERGDKGFGSSGR